MEQVPLKNNKALYTYFLIIVLDSISFGLVGPILAPLLTHSNFFPSHIGLINFSLYGIVISLFPLAFMLSSPILGLLSDHFGRRRILLICLLLALVAFTFYILAFIRQNIFLL